MKIFDFRKNHFFEKFSDFQNFRSQKNMFSKNVIFLKTSDSGVFKKITFFEKIFFEIENFENPKNFRKSDFFENRKLSFFKIIFSKKYFLKIELSKNNYKKFSAVTFEQMNIFLQIQKHMKRIVRSFHFRYWTSQTDHYAKSYPDFSLG